MDLLFCPSLPSQRNTCPSSSQHYSLHVCSPSHELQFTREHYYTSFLSLTWTYKNFLSKQSHVHFSLTLKNPSYIPHLPLPFTKKLTKMLTYTPCLHFVIRIYHHIPASAPPLKCLIEVTKDLHVTKKSVLCPIVTWHLNGI